ncbi:reverse transcriptase domain-containing protein [Tanacetum coccineum]|uniref:Reverse transcriptase domain-containing protein n=1 Tax=Tanacetum coccineum TaxID=301880 RepID=A0ABQ5D352_9ASTR
MTTPVEKRNANKFCEFHGEVGHNTDECMHLRKHIEEMLKAGKLSHLVKEIKKTTERSNLRQRITQSFSPNSKISFLPLGEDEGTEGPMIIEAEIGGHCVHHMYVDGRSALEILYEHCFSRLRPEIKRQLIPATTPLIGFSGEIIWPIGQIQLLVTIGDEEHSALALMNFVVVGSPSPYNGIIGRPRVRKLQAVPLTVHGMLKIPVDGGIITLKSSRIKVAINPEYPEQSIMIGSTLTEEGRNKLCSLLQQNLDVFAWKPADMTGVPRHIAEHRLNVQKGCFPVRQKKSGQAADRNQAIQEEVGKLVEAGIMREVHYHDWLSNPVMVESLCGFPFKCFLDAYKGYHQIKMAKEDEEKIAFIMNQGIFCYTKMPFGLRNAEATYQHLVDNAFHKQIGRNLKVYVDDLVIKSRTEDEIVRDIEETFQTLREINMKLNPKKCTFGIEEGMFLGYKVSTRGLKVCTDKVDAVLSLPSPKCLKDVQKLNGKLASLNRFLAKSADKSLPFFKTLKKARGKAIFIGLRKRKKHSSKLLPNFPCTNHSHHGPTNTIGIIKTRSSRKAKKWSIELGEYAIHYRPIVSVKRQILADFIVERPEEESLDTLIGEEEELPEPWILFTDGSSCTDGFGAGLILTNPEGMEFTYALRFRFDATNNKAEYEALIVGLNIAKQMGVKNLQANVDLRLVASQVNGTYVAKENDMVRYLEKVKTFINNFKAFSIKQVPRSENKKADALSKIASTSFAHLSKQVLVEELKEKSISIMEVFAVVEEEGDTWMTPIFKYLMDGTLPAEVKKARAVKRKSWRFSIINGTLYKKSFLRPWLRCVGPLQANYVLREIHEGSYSMHARTRSIMAKALRIGYYWLTMHEDARKLIRACQDCQVHKPVLRSPQKKLSPITSPWPFYKFGLPGEIISDNGKQFQDNPLGEGIKARLEERSKNWMEELPHVLWAQRTMIKSSNGNTPFSLTYGTEAVIPLKIGMPTLRTAEVDLVQNDEALEINLDLLEEQREQAVIREAKSKAKMERYYNSKVRSISFKPWDLVYRNNDASRAEDIGKLGPKWEGPYEVTEALGKGVYKLRDCDEKQLPRTWNISNLKKCYVHQM